MEISNGWLAREDLDLLNRSFLLAPPPPIDLSTGRDPSCLAITAAKENHAEYQELIIAPHGPPAHQVDYKFPGAAESPSAARAQLSTQEVDAAAGHQQRSQLKAFELYAATATARNPLQRAAKLASPVRSICAAETPGTIRDSSLSDLPDLLATSLAQPPLRGYDEQGSQLVYRPLSRAVIATMERTPFKYKEPLAPQAPPAHLCQHCNTSQRHNRSSSDRCATAAPTCKPTGPTLPITAA
ncbi:hypothetical protein PCANC_12505 [Puccinia coronata f. sp. avenae]|uniref:Uncharacterized protein n=1 Tax=Puccinia coronata f. sp. avenae TaxID=200324 RepID=A0A2N5ULH7_9BASI|nr:hypothetical protein PCANC_12505 [Puccinia coronata f. sp. avenae]